MKKMLIFFALVFGLVSCQKSALTPQHYEPVVETWVAQEGHDTAAYSATVFCSASNKGVVDTIKLYYTKAPNDPNKFGYYPGAIYFHQPGGRTPTENPDLYSRKYAELLKKL